MEKRKPTHGLEAFKASVARGEASFTRTAIRDARAIGFALDDMKAVIATMTRRHFFKSMTSHADHRS